MVVLGKELPPSLKTFMDSHQEGVVLAAFGSGLKSTKMKPELKQLLMNAFKRSSVPIIWKWDGDDQAEMPENVMIKKWLPQNDLLAHPNLKALVFHGGLLSLQEALYHGVPVVGIPMGWDQLNNMLRAEKNGYGISLPNNLWYNSLTEDGLVDAITKAFSDESMRTSVKRMQKLFLDRGTTGQSPMERAIGAVDYALGGEGITNALFLMGYTSKTMTIRCM